METLRRAFVHRSIFESSLPVPGNFSNEKTANFPSASGASTSTSGASNDATGASGASNDDLINQGDEVMKIYVKGYLRYHFQQLPEEGIKAIANYLMTDSMLSYVGSHLGITDLIQAKDFPFDDALKSRQFKAIVGALAQDSGIAKAEIFVQDFLLTQLVGVDVAEIWQVMNPMGVLADILRHQGRSEPEPRLIRQSGAGTVSPIYMVGIYVDREEIGEGAGETVLIAEEMAARDALRNLFGLQENRAPLSFGNEGHRLDFSEWKAKENFSLASIAKETQEKNAMEPEPLDFGEILLKYKEGTEKLFGFPYRRRLMHKFYPGTIGRKPKTAQKRPKPWLL